MVFTVRDVFQAGMRTKADIDSNMLSPIALVTVYSANPGDLGKNHQVLAYGYELDDSNQLTLHVYDPNTAPEQADGVRLKLNPGSSAAGFENGT